jgi:hypothetical protein
MNVMGALSAGAASTVAYAPPTIIGHWTFSAAMAPAPSATASARTVSLVQEGLRRFGARVDREHATDRQDLAGLDGCASSKAVDADRLRVVRLDRVVGHNLARTVDQCGARRRRACRSSG